MGQTILITGASSGIGSSLAYAFSETGNKLFLTARNKDRLEEVANKCSELGAEVVIKKLDILDTTATLNWVKQIDGKVPLDIVIANAGIMQACEADGKIETLETSLRQINTNLSAPISLSSTIIPRMQKRGQGQVVFIASLSGLQPVADVPSYSASKAGLIAYGEALGNYLHGQGIVITTIAPGFITTPMSQKYISFRPFEISAEKAAQKIKKAILKKKQFAAFPLTLELAIRSGRFLPARLRRITNKPFNFT